MSLHQQTGREGVQCQGLPTQQRKCLNLTRTQNNYTTSSKRKFEINLKFDRFLDY